MVLLYAHFRQKSIFILLLRNKQKGPVKTEPFNNNDKSGYAAFFVKS